MTVGFTLSIAKTSSILFTSKITFWKNNLSKSFSYLFHSDCMQSFMYYLFFLIENLLILIG